MQAGEMAVVGLTGGIASGKSTVARRLRELGIAVIDADRIAREIVAPGEPALEAIRRAFGDDMIQPDGSLDRARLGARVFADRRELDRLNALTHPAIREVAERRRSALQRAGHRWIVYEAALIVEHDLAPGLDELVVVLTAPATQVARIAARDGLGQAAAWARVNAQTDNATRRAAADRVIDNDGDVTALLAATDQLIAALDDRYGTNPTG